jgi:hypothetical protein
MLALVRSMGREKYNRYPVVLLSSEQTDKNKIQPIKIGNGDRPFARRALIDAVSTLQNWKPLMENLGFSRDPAKKTLPDVRSLDLFLFDEGFRENESHLYARLSTDTNEYTAVYVTPEGGLGGGLQYATAQVYNSPVLDSNFEPIQIGDGRTPLRQQDLLNAIDKIDKWQSYEGDPNTGGGTSIVGVY